MSVAQPDAAFLSSSAALKRVSCLEVKNNKYSQGVHQVLRSLKEGGDASYEPALLVSGVFLTEAAMKNLSILIFTQLCKACAELTFRHLSQNQCLELSCSPQQGLGSLTGFSLYHRSAQSQTTVLSLAEGGELRVNLEHRGRLQLRGGLASQQVNVTISHLQHSDTGLYMWELRYRNEDDSAAVASAQRTFLLVEAAGSLCHCSHRYLPLTLTIFTAAGLLLFALGWLLTETCVKPRLRPSHPTPIYEEMTRRQQTAGTPQNNYEAPAHLEEAHFPVYANPNIRQPQDEYYASPRQLALRA